MIRNRMSVCALLVMFLLAINLPVFAIGEDTDDTPPAATAPEGAAVIVDDQGGPTVITGTVTYTNPFFTLGTAQPLVILEDQAGFVDRNEFFLFPPESQVLAQITSDFRESPFGYSLALPIEPRGTLRDVDNNGNTDVGVMTFAVAYWTNTFGDPILEERDQGGGGWSTAYASTRISTDPATRREIVGGKLVIYAPEAGQGFPAGFGQDGLLFTEDDPIVIVPQGWTIVDLDTNPYTFNRASEQFIELIEPDGVAVSDFSQLSYSAAFDAMAQKFRTEYAFNDYYGLNWDDFTARYRPRFVAAEQSADPQAYALALRDLLWEIPDGHVNMSLDLLLPIFQSETDGGIGIAIRELDDGRVLTNFVLDGSPAAQAGVQIGTEITAIDGVAISQVLDNTFIWASVALSTQHTKRLQQLRYATRFEVGTPLSLSFINGDGAETTTDMVAVAERQSFNFSSFSAGISGTELPVEFRILPSGYGYAAIYSFSDNEYLTVQLWERMIETFKQANVPGIIVDMRNNGGGNGFLATQMAAYFFQEQLAIGNTGYYSEEIDDFFFDERGQRQMYLPPEEFRYDGPVAVLVAPACFSACEFFSYALTIEDRAEVVGFYPTGGLGGSIEQFYMPSGINITFTIGRAVDANGNIHIEGKGVQPTVDVPVTEESLFSTGDPVLEAAEQAMTERIRGVFVNGGTLAFGDTLGTLSTTGVIQPGEAIQYTVSLPVNAIVSLIAGDDAGSLDTVLNVYDQTGVNLLVSNDNVDDTTLNSALRDLETGPNALTVIVEVQLKRDAPAGGSFFLRIEAAPIAP